MNTTNNTILITGGGSGIGFETAKLLSERGNKVIITGRTVNKLKEAAVQLNNVTTITADITDEADVSRLVHTLKLDFPELNMIMNNAGKAFVYPLVATPNVFAMAQAEMLTNYLAIIRLNELLLPALKQQQEAAIINVSSIVAFVPGSSLASYSASKAALHSYTQSLRLALEPTAVKVFELMPPLVNTDFSKEIGGHNGIAPAVVAGELVDALTNNVFEIRVGQTEDMYRLHLSSPENAFAAMNAVAE